MPWATVSNSSSGPTTVPFGKGSISSRPPLISDTVRQKSSNTFMLIEPAAHSVCMRHLNCASAAAGPAARPSQAVSANRPASSFGRRLDLNRFGIPYLP